MSDKIVEAINEGRIKTAFIHNISSDNSSYSVKECKIVKVLQFHGNIILRLKPWKGYPLGHKYLYRSLDEVL